MKQLIMAVFVGTSATVIAWHRLPKTPAQRPAPAPAQTAKVEPARPSVKRRHVASRPKKSPHAKTELASRKSWDSSR